MTRHARHIPFTKVVGAGNDFVIVDNRRGALNGTLARLARRMCDRRDGIGADGLLAAERSRRGDVRMRVFNPDGSEPEMCGNGARCFALYASEHHLAPRQMRLETKAGVLEAQVKPGRRVRLEMPRPCRFDSITLRVTGRTLRLHCVQVGNPHVVVLTRRLEREDVAGLGRLIRHHRRFAPAGTNVNFIQPGRAAIRIRTYERGVEDETPACGTGVTAAAAVTWRQWGRKSPMTLITRSGDRLRVSLTLDSNAIQRAFLEGPARIVFTGHWATEGN